jgi:hypothetical protein
MFLVFSLILVNDQDLIILDEEILPLIEIWASVPVANECVFGHNLSYLLMSVLIKPFYDLLFLTPGVKVFLYVLLRNTMASVMIA